MSGTCGSPSTTTFGSSGTQALPAGLIDDAHALVIPVVLASTATVDIKHAGDQTFSRTAMTANMGAVGYPALFVVGVEATTHYAVLVTNDVPVLIAF